MNVYLAEFVGTAILMFLGNSVVANVVLKDTKGNGGGWIVITMGWGLAVALAVYAVGRISGAHINPAVTVGLASIGSFPWAQVPGYIAAQVAGAFCGQTLVWLSYLPHWKATEDKGAKFACFSTSPAIRNIPGAFINEFLGTAFLVFTVLSIGKVASGLDQALSDAVAIQSMGDINGIQEGLKAAFGTFFAPLLVGLLVLSIGLSRGGPTGYAINPARDFGPRLAHTFLPVAGKGGSDWGYAWLPIVAPLLGGIAGAQLFVLLGL